MRNEPMRRNELPETCFSILPSSGQLIIIRCGERGYYPSEWDTGKREENREIASSHNARRGITDIQEAAMLAGSMFGWNTPGANPQWYLDNARATCKIYRKKNLNGSTCDIFLCSNGRKE